MAQFVKSKREENAHHVNKIDGEAASKMIADSQGLQSPKIIFDEDEASRLGLKLGSRVEVAPEDNGKST